MRSPILSWIKERPRKCHSKWNYAKIYWQVWTNTYHQSIKMTLRETWTGLRAVLRVEKLTSAFRRIFFIYFFSDTRYYVQYCSFGQSSELQIKSTYEAKLARDRKAWLQCQQLNLRTMALSRKTVFSAHTPPRTSNTFQNTLTHKTWPIALRKTSRERTSPMAVNRSGVYYLLTHRGKLVDMNK